MEEKKINPTGENAENTAENEILEEEAAADNTETTEAAEDESAAGEQSEKSEDGDADSHEKKGTRTLKKEIKALGEEKKKLEEQVAEYDDRYKRMAAEYDNFRKRAAKEREGAYTDAYADALKEILPVIDNLERALGYADNADDKLAEGVRMTLKQFAETLTRMGVEAYGEVGDTFDPEIHNAVMHGEDDTKGEGEITDVFQKGYRRGDKIIRFAMVKSVN